MGKVLKLREMIEGYRLFCRAGGRSPKSIRWYMHKLRIFEKYLRSQGFPLEVGRITTEHLRQFLVHLRESVKADELNPYKPAADRPLSPHTIRGYAQALKAFFSWATQEGLIEQSPAKRLVSPKAPQTVVPTFSEAEVKRLLSVIDRKSPTGFRDYCVILTFLDTGIRLSELASLQLGHLDLEQGHFQVRGKGDRERVVPMGVSLQKCLWKYLNRYRPDPCNPAVGNLFLTREGHPIAPNTVYHLVRRYGRLAGITGVRCSPHTFRHTFAKNYLLNGGDLFSLQKILGHSSLVVVRMYVNLASTDIRDQHRRCSPVDRLRLKS